LIAVARSVRVNIWAIVVGLPPLIVTVGVADVTGPIVTAVSTPFFADTRYK
jgi:hypothetical protein